MADRPLQFRMNGGHPLANGLVFAGLGRHSLSTYYHDSCADLRGSGNHGTLTDMDPPTEWVWDSFLGRWGTYHAGSVLAQYVALNQYITFGVGYTLAVWLRTADALGSYEMFAGKVGQTTVLGLRSTGIYVRVGASGLTFSKTIAVNSLYHVVVSHISDTQYRVWCNGVDLGAQNLSGDFLLYHLGCGYSGYYFDGTMCDPMVWSRMPSASEIQRLADPSNTMLSGLILPPKRRIFAAATAALTGFKPYWATRRQKVIGGGVI